MSLPSRIECSPSRCRILFGGQHLSLDVRRALWWEEEELLAVADMHLGKAAAFHDAGLLLPPYETMATLARLQKLIEDYQPRTLLSVGDAFHRKQADALLDAEERHLLESLMARVPNWIWIIGNHDPLPPKLGGLTLPIFAHHGLTFAHEVGDAPDAAYRLCGHYHPKARLHSDGGRWRKHCFAWNENGLFMPAFGSLAGGLDVSGPVLSPLLGQAYQVMLCDVRQPVPLPSHRLHGG